MSSAGEYRTATRIMEMVRLVQDAPYASVPVNRLAEKLDVHRRTIRRWAKGLEAVAGDDGKPVVRLFPGTQGREARVVAPTGQGTTTPADLRALALGLAATRYLAATGARDLEDYAERLMARLGRHAPDARARIAHAFHYIPFGAKSYRLKPDEVDAVFSGVIFQRTLEFDYHRPRAQQPLHVRAEPWSLVFYRDALYMLGRRLSHKEPALRTYAIDRMSQVRTDRSARFEVPSDFDPADHFGDLGLWKPPDPRERLELLFTAEVAPLVKERSWPRTDCWEESHDGGFRLVLDIRISPEVESWLLGYGASVEVVEPVRLRKKMAAQAGAMKELYAHSSDVPELRFSVGDDDPH